jgi:surface antigen
MLGNAQNGRMVSWYSKKRLSNGKVRVVHSYPVSGGYCRSYQSYIKIGNKEKHMTNIACKEDWMPGWRFYK